MIAMSRHERLIPSGLLVLRIILPIAFLALQQGDTSKNGGVVLMHCHYVQMASLVEDVVPTLPEEGYHFVRMRHRTISNTNRHRRR